MEDFYHIYFSKQIFNTAVSPVPRETLFSIHIITVSASQKIVPPWKKRCHPSWTYPFGKWSKVLTINWSTENIYYLIFIPQHKCFFSRNDRLLDHIRIALHCASKLTRSTLWAWTVCSWFELIQDERCNYHTKYNIYILVSRFQLQNSSSFCGTNKFSFPSDPTHG